MICGACSITSCQASVLESSTRSGFVSTRARNSSPSDAPCASEVLAELQRVGGAVRHISHRVDVQGEVAQAEIAIEAVREVDHLDVELGVVDPEDLGPDLVVLAVPPLLRALVPEMRRDVPHLPGQGGVVLHERTDHARSPLGSQREAPPTLVLEVVHLLADDVGGLPEALEHLDVLEDRREHQPEAEAGRAGRERLDQRAPAAGLGRKDVVRADRRAEPGPVVLCVRRAVTSAGHRRIVPVVVSTPRAIGRA